MTLKEKYIIAHSSSIKEPNEVSFAPSSRPAFAGKNEPTPDIF